MSTLTAYPVHIAAASLARCALVPPKALSRWQAGGDPASRRRGSGGRPRPFDG